MPHHTFTHNWPQIWPFNPQKIKLNPPNLRAIPGIPATRVLNRSHLAFSVKPQHIWRHHAAPSPVPPQECCNRFPSASCSCSPKTHTVLFQRSALTCGGFDLVGVTLDFFDDGVHLDDVGDPGGQSGDEVGVLCVGNPNLVWKTKVL